MKIINEKEMPLLNRKRVTLDLEHLNSKTPSREEIKKKLSAILKSPEDLVAIRHVYTKFGQGESKVIAHVYNKKEDLDYLEKKKVKKQKEDGKKEEEK
ncbi:MAG: 30S ribosomal protein S24e [Nanoarchaeota archaeon]|nr:30S ribosomal protein S24e [Nanoarchaeota archaeon]MBU0962293.1 30S ribosomal protein S24e [Nanoarchaeota archaeon]